MFTPQQKTTTHQKAKMDARKRLFATRFKTEMCRTFTTEGACPYGPKCMFAHGDDDLRTEALNTAEGLTSSNAVRMWIKRATVTSVALSMYPARSETQSINSLQSLGESPSYLLTTTPYVERSPSQAECWNVRKPSLRPYRHDPYAPVMPTADSWVSNSSFYVAT